METATQHLEQLRSIINSSIDIVQQDLACHGDPPLDLAAQGRHPQRDRHEPKVNRALKSLSSAGAMLRALCDPEGLMHDIMFNVRTLSPSMVQAVADRSGLVGQVHDLTALFVITQANIVNKVGKCPRHLTQLAQETDIDRNKLSSCMQALCNLHIFQEVAPDTYANNELSLLFQSESRRALVGLCADESRLASCKLWDAISPGGAGNGSRKSGFHLAYNTNLNIYDWWQQVRPDLGARGAIAFTGKGLNIGQYLSLYPWRDERECALVVDVGGGAGGATLPFLREYGHLHLQVQDRPETRCKFDEFLLANYPDVARSGRATFLAQDFLEPQATRRADVYFLRHVLHNWDDATATKILKNLAPAISVTSKLLVCEHVLMPVYASQRARDGAPDAAAMFLAPEPLLANWGASFTSRLDLHMQAMLNARQRTVDDFEKLFAGAGFELSKVWKNTGDETIFECRL